MRTGILAAVVLVIGMSTAEATTIVWEWTGTVTGYDPEFTCRPGSLCSNKLESVVPLGTTIGVVVSFDLGMRPPNPSIPCYRGTGTTSLRVLGRTYTNTGYVWDEGWGFGPGVCKPGYDAIEVVAPSWGSGGVELPDGWIPFIDFESYLPGLWWGGDLTTVQPKSISSQFPKFYQPGRAVPQRFHASLHAVQDDTVATPEPATWLLFSGGLAAEAWRRRRRS